ncbi:MAG: laccase, partial [Rhodocyclales bacterium]|nr:laccase [Rhodocyclales bacterium]
MAVAAAIAAQGVVQLAHAGAGWGDNLDFNGRPIKVPTFYANSPTGLRTNYDPTPGATAQVDSGTALRKFVDGLPGLTAAGANNLGQYLPLAVADTTSFVDSDYYELAVVEYGEKMHSDLPKPTTLRGYVQIETPANAAVSKHFPLAYPDGSPILDAAGNQVYAVDKPHYLGPVVLASKGRAVRFKFSNYLPKGGFDPLTGRRNGDLFLPVDTTLLGAARDPVGDMYPQNRATIHLHGGDAPWISDGTPYQWITPYGERKLAADPATWWIGASTRNVPDMPDPGEGAQTFYYPNNQSARLMFYHDHASGLTRVNVYGGEAAGYVLLDNTEAKLIAKGVIPPISDMIPLVIQDKTFVPKDIVQQDARWDTARWGDYGDLWFPHVYETNQDPNSFDGTNPVGRWDYGPWFWPIFPAPEGLPTGVFGDASTTPEAFMDTPVVNGTAYPTLSVQPKA